MYIIIEMETADQQEHYTLITDYQQKIDIFEGKATHEYVSQK